MGSFIQFGHACSQYRYFFLFEYYINYYNILFVFTWKRMDDGEVMCHVRMAFSNHNNGIFKSRYDIHQFINNHI